MASDHDHADHERDQQLGQREAVLLAQAVNITAPARSEPDVDQLRQVEVDPAWRGVAVPSGVVLSYVPTPQVEP